MAQKRKDRALLALKKKRLRDEQLKQLDNWLINVEGLVSGWVLQGNQIKTGLS